MSRTLPANILANYLKPGTSPRVYVSIPSAGLFPSTKSGGSFTGRLKSAGRITWDIDPFGGLGTVSGVTIENLELGEDFDLATSASIEPKQESGRLGAGRMFYQGSLVESWADVRGSLVAQFDTPGVIAGRSKVTSHFYNYRGILQFSIPAGLTSCEHAAITLEGLADNSTARDFELYLVQGAWTVYAASGMYNDCVGWDTGLAAYYGTVLNKTWTSHMMDVTSGSRSNTIILNAEGRKLIEDNAGGTLKLMVLSKDDYDGEDGVGEPTGAEYIAFKASNITLELKYNTLYLDNREATVYLAYEPVPSSTADMLKLWTGAVDNWSIDDRTLSLELRQNDFVKNAAIPKCLISLSDYPYCPEANIGQPMPVVIGDFTTSTAQLRHENGIGYFTGSGTHAFGAYLYGYTNNFIKALSVDNRVEASLRVLLAEHAMKNSGKPFYFWDSQTERYQVYPVTPSTDTPDKSEVSKTLAYDHLLFPTVIETVYSPLRMIIPTGHTVLNTPLNPERAYDRSGTNYATFDDLNDTIYFYWNYKDINLSRYLAVICVVEYAGGATDPSLQAVWQYTTDNGTTWANWGTSPNFANLPSGQTRWVIAAFPYEITVNYQIDMLSQVRLYITRNAGGAGTCRLNNVALVISGAQGENRYDSLMTQGQGAMYGSWIDDSGRASTKNENDLIENPAHAMEWVAREYMGLTNTGIDTAAMDAAATTLALWKHAFEILEREDTSRIVDAIAKQGRLNAYWTNENKLSCLVFDEDAAFPNAGANTPDIPVALDIIDEDAGTTGGVFVNNPMNPETFIIEHMTMEDVKNDFVLKYRKNYASGEFEGLLYITNGLGVRANVETNIQGGYLENGQSVTGTETSLDALCADCYNVMLTTNTWEFEADCIRDEATATKLIQYWIERLTTRRKIVSFETQMTALGVELGDFINIRHHRLQSLFGTPIMNYKRWEIIRIEYDLDRFVIGIRAIEV